ncbi:hypothetical protein MJO28_006381 [Puccinia striiformis f. sp. tritici]|uniref:Uncharacterized protein n=1 Tax=Puccinia striiformis f. sp. tritici TaxID=168172 RepID=A0ACC0EH97_9BASI|nr:hypothetical protein MJO28_006381 [Puccinia striiformis f. sp. tritici]
MVFLPKASNSIDATPSGDLQKEKKANQVRFEEDLEFVQSLANPHFVQELTLNGALRSETMISYLQYLKYFHDPDYARFVRYPNSLKILDLLNCSEQSRTMIETDEHAQLLTTVKPLKPHTPWWKDFAMWLGRLCGLKDYIWAK